MDHPQSLAYVSTMAQALRLPMDEARIERVAAHLQRTAALADLLESAMLGAHDEPAALYCPAVFPAADEDAP